MARTFESAKREERQEDEREEREGRSRFDQETPIQFEGDDLGEKFRDISTFLRLGDIRGQDRGFDPGETIRERRPEFSIDILGREVPLPEIDLSQLDTTEILGVIAQTLITNLELQADIANFLQPPTQITLSGTVTIDESDVAQEAFPNIFTRRVFLRASPNNTDDIYFGDDQVEPQDGFVLQKGEWIVFPFNLATTTIWMASETEDEVVQVIGVA